MDPKDLQYPNVPKHTREALEAYWKHGWEPGSFTTAMLANDLFTAAYKADHMNKSAMGHIVEYIINEGPSGSYGNYDTVKDWCNRGRAFQAYEKKRVLDILSND